MASLAASGGNTELEIACALLRPRHVRLQQHPHIAGVGDAAGPGLGLHRVQEGGGQAHVQRGGLRLDLKAHGRETRQVVLGQIRGLDEVFRLGIAGQRGKGLRMGVHNARSPSGACSGR